MFNMPLSIVSLMNQVSDRDSRSTNSKSVPNSSLNSLWISSNPGYCSVLNFRRTSAARGGIVSETGIEEHNSKLVPPLAQGQLRPTNAWNGRRLGRLGDGSSRTSHSRNTGALAAERLEAGDLSMAWRPTPYLMEGELDNTQGYARVGMPTRARHREPLPSCSVIPTRA